MPSCLGCQRSFTNYNLRGDLPLIYIHSYIYIYFIFIYCDQENYSTKEQNLIKPLDDTVQSQPNVKN